MKIVLQRCTAASVTVEGQVTGAIQLGCTVFLGVAQGDTMAEASKLANKVAALRIFNDATGRMNLGLGDVGGAVLLISNFTLCGDVRKGNRPSFTGAAAPGCAKPLFEAFATLLREKGLPVECGVFGADMQVRVENDGPVTLLLEA